MTRTAVCLMGPTASGKTEVAVRLCERFPFSIVSVDSALVYRGMDIGTAKPGADTRKRAEHRLIDIRDPEEAYSAGEFVADAVDAMDAIFARGRIPLLVGGTMMYFQALIRGIAALPPADAHIRAQIDAEAAQHGWPALHRRLCEVDPDAAARIAPNDSQRLQRALEVYRSSGRPISAWQAEGRAESPAADLRYLRTALWIEDRQRLHERIEQRLNLMLNNGFVDEMKVLYSRPGLTGEAPSMRAVGYRQFWRYLAGECSFEEARYRTLVATRQLAKRQITWLRSDPEIFCVDPLEADAFEAISTLLAGKLAQFRSGRYTGL